MEPIYYPLFGKIFDTRSHKRLRISNFKALLLSDTPVAQTVTPNYTIISLSGIYKYGFTSLTEWIKSYNLLNQNQGTKIKNTYSVQIQHDIIEVSGDIDKFGQFIQDYYLRLVNSYSTDDNNYINIFLFSVFVSVTLSTFPKTYFLEKLIDLTFNNKNSDFNEIESFFNVAPSQYYSRILNDTYDGYLVPSPPNSGIIVKTGIPQYKLIGHDLSYSVFWITSRVRIRQLVGLLTVEDSLICCYHLFPTFDVHHVHIFKDLDTGIDYILYCLYRSYKAQFKFQTKDTIQNSDRRGCYIPISSRILQEEFIRRFKISPNAALFLPCWTNNLDFLSLNCDKFKELFTLFIEYHFRTVDFNNYATVMDTIVVFSGMRALLPPSRFINELRINYVLHNILDADTNNFSTLVYDGNPVMLNNPMLQPSNGGISEEVNVKFQSNVDSVYMIGMSILLPVQEQDALYKPIINLAQYRSSHDFTGPLKTLFKHVLSPQNYERIFFSAEIYDTLTVFQRLYLSAYVYDVDINWRIDDGELNVISSELVARGSYNRWNTSSFKAVWGITHFFVVNAEGLERNASILFLGATDEPSIAMLRHFLRSNWIIKATGLFTREVGTRAEFLYDYVGKEHCFIYSDIDMSIFSTVDEIVIFFDSLIRKVMTLFTENSAPNRN